VTTTMLELREISKVYGTGAAQVNALRRVNLSVRGGELVAIMGPSGSGKSSLLTIAGSLEEPTSGQVLVAGTDLTHLSPDNQARLRRRLIGYVFQDFNLLAGFTAIENVTVPLELDGTSARAAHAAGMKALAELGIAERAQRFPDELSGGERQRVAIARAVVGDRRLLLADEPTGALDSVNAQAVMQLMLAICRRGVAGVVVTHDAQLASSADRVVFLQDGQVVEHAKTSAGPDPRLAPGARR
jgi:putative ABC transport system ATP-binding protein